MDAEFEAVLEKACSTQGGKLKAAYALQDLNKIADAHATEATRLDAEAALEIWASGERGELRKGLAMAWLARARAAVAPAAGALAGAAKKVDAKVGSVGAAAGEKLARSPLNAKGMAAARQAGGDQARERLASRLAPRGTQPAAMSAGPAARPIGPQLMPEHQPRHFGAEQAMASGHVGSGMAPEQRTAAVHADALHAAFRAGAEHAGNAHAGAAARLGRVAARNGFRAGLAIAGAGAGGAGIHAALSEKEHQQRVDAGKHSHQSHAMAGAAR